MSPENWFSKQDEKYIKELLCAATNNLNMLRESNGWRDSDEKAWASGATLFQEVHRYVERICTQRGRTRMDLREDIKDKCAEAWIGDFYCRLRALSIAESKALEYDSPRTIRLDIFKLEQEIKRYWILHESIWNTLRYNYDQWSEEWRNQGLKEEADELQTHMLQARLKYRLWVIAPGLVGRGGRWLQARESKRESRASQRLSRRQPTPGRKAHFLASLRFTQSRIVRFFDAIRSLAEYLLFRVGQGLFWPFVLFMFLPIVFLGLIYAWKGWVCMDRGGGAEALPAHYRVWYSIVFSALVFTGSEPGQLTSCPGHAFMYTLMSIESLGAFIIITLIIGYMVNRLSSR